MRRIKPLFCANLEALFVVDNLKSINYFEYYVIGILYVSIHFTFQTQIYSHYRSPDYLQKYSNLEIPKNFPTFVNTYSSCLIHIINYEGLNLNIVQAVVLSRLDAVIVIRNNRFVVFRGIPFEKLAANVSTYYLLANKLKHLNVVFKSRQWYCEVHLHLFPPSKSDRPSNFHTKLQINKHTVQSSHFYLTYKSNEILSATHLSARFWKRLPEELTMYSLITNFFETRLRHDILIAGSSFDGTFEWVKGLHFNQMSLLSLPTVNWELFKWHVSITNTVKVGMFCRFCSSCHTLREINVVSNVVKQIEQLRMFVDHTNRDTDQVIWKLKSFYPRHNFGQFLPYQRNSNHLSRKLYFHLELGEFNDLTLNVQTLLYHIVGNSSYQVANSCDQISSDVNNCGCMPDNYDEFLYPQLSFVEAHEMVPIHFPIHQKSFVFVACGYLKGDLPYAELVGSHDKYSWTTIFWFLVVTVSVVLSVLTIIRERCIHKQKYSKSLGLSFLLERYTFASLKNLLEQGLFEDGDEKFVKSNLGIRLVGSSVLLAAVLLSNAYKGDNIANIISPLPPILYSKVEQLVADSYEIYSSSLANFPWIPDAAEVWNLLQSCEDCVTPRGSHCFAQNITMVDLQVVSVSVFSELYNSLKVNLWGEKSSQKKFGSCSLGPTNLSIKHNNILNHSKMPPPNMDFVNWQQWLNYALYNKFTNCSDQNIA